MYSNTLIIKHLPHILSDKEKEDLMKHFGAVEVNCVSSKLKKYSVVFARFQNEVIAEQVLHQLHQLNVLGSCLTVEYAIGKRYDSLQKSKLKDIDWDKETDEEKYYKKFIERLNSWHSNVNFRQPVPSHLKYQYPPPDQQILTNITKVLATVPKFYTQVLHLMNKMNLPCPFGKEILPEMTLTIFPSTVKEKQVPVEIPQEAEKEVVPEDSHEEISDESMESEISSDEETKQPKETVPEQHNIRKKKTIKVPKFVKPVAVQSKKPQRKTKFEEVFEKVPEETETKKIKLSQHLGESVCKTGKLDVLTDSSKSDDTGFGYIHPISKPAVVQPEIDLRDEREEERLEKEEIVCISAEELASNRISEKDRSILPVFKNYAEGVPTCRLYIKNLGKTVGQDDLRFIYNRYLSQNIEDQPNMFDIRLMQEGRMKGQAFVTLQTVQLAQSALKETNGYILKDKPLVVQFARSATK